MVGPRGRLAGVDSDENELHLAATKTKNLTLCLSVFEYSLEANTYKVEILHCGTIKTA